MIRKIFIGISFIMFALLILKFSVNKMEKKFNNRLLRINYFSTSSSFNPHLSKDISDSSLCKALYEGLTRKNIEGEVELAAAEELVISEDKKRYTFTLRDTKWSNGERVTSYHFEDAWKRALDPQKSKCLQVKKFFYIKNAEETYKGKLDKHSLGIKTPNDKTIIVEFKHPAPFLEELLADPIFSPIYDLDKDPTVFNGPFIVKELEREKQLILTTNPLYWDKKAVKLKEVQISFIKDEKTAFSMYEKGHLDWIGSPFTNISTEAINNHSNIQSQATCSPFWVFFNTEDPKFKSASIRKALSFAIDRSEIVKAVVPYQKELFTILPTGISLLDEKLVSQNSTLKNAQKLFEDGLKELNIERADFKITLDHSNISDHAKLAEYLKHQWERVFGIRVLLKKSDWSTFYSSIRSGKYEMGGFYICNIINNPLYLLETFKKRDICYSKWCNKSYQKWLDLAIHTSNEQERKLYLKNAEQLLLDEMPVIPIYNQSNLYLCRDGLKNLTAPKFGYMDFKWASYD